jgi:hypothetical protein
MYRAPQQQCPTCGLWHDATPRGWRDHMNSSEHYALTGPPPFVVGGPTAAQEIAEHVATSGRAYPSEEVSL